ncbi:MAG: arginine deiminase [Synergistales bacterium]|nr:arginine deiminase [Synergistales bacterium]
MNSKRSFFVGSEIGRLKRVLLHRPGRELERLTIENKDELLFDDILWVEEAQKEHDAFADLLRDNGVEVVYYQNCLADILRDQEIRSSLVDEVLSLEALDVPLALALKINFMEMDTDELAEILVTGLSHREAEPMLGSCRSLVLRVTGPDDFLIRPLPNLYFQRDPHCFINDGVILSVMNFNARGREPLYSRYIFKHHPYFEHIKIIFGDELRDTYPYTIEGGDVLVLSEDTVAIGISQRTNAGAAQIVGRRLAQRVGIRRVLAVDIPKIRASMHLDTVFTMVDRDACTIYPGLGKRIKVAELLYDEEGNLEKIIEHDNLEECLQRTLELDRIRLIETGGGDPVAAARDQWNDGTNTLSIAPGEVVTYRRNIVSNRYLRENGVKVYEIRGAELGRGRGGPRCMSMPLLREPLSE